MIIQKRAVYDLRYFSWLFPGLLLHFQVCFPSLTLSLEILCIQPIHLLSSVWSQRCSGWSYSALLELLLITWPTFLKVRVWSYTPFFVLWLLAIFCFDLFYHMFFVHSLKIKEGNINDPISHNGLFSLSSQNHISFYINKEHCTDFEKFKWRLKLLCLIFNFIIDFMIIKECILWKKLIQGTIVKNTETSILISFCCVLVVFLSVYSF